jgi:hypothetical protein
MVAFLNKMVDRIWANNQSNFVQNQAPLQPQFNAPAPQNNIGYSRQQVEEFNTSQDSMKFVPDGIIPYNKPFLSYLKMNNHLE